MFWYLSVVAIILVVYLRSGPKVKLPDGPRGVPFIGIIPDKTTKLYQQFASFVPKYGDFFFSKLGRSNIIVLSSPTAIDELMVKRGGKYASRPTSSAQAQIIGQSRLVTMKYGEEFRKHRKLIHSLLGMQNTKTFVPYQEYESRQTLKNLLQKPDEFYAEVARYSTSVTFSLLMGARLDSSNSTISDAIRTVAVDMFSKLRPGYWWADYIPVLNYVPDVYAPWRTEARKTFDNLLEFWSVFFDAIALRTAKGVAPECFLRRFLESPEVSGFSDIDRRIILSELLAAGSETTATALQWLFKAALLYPDFIKAAQEELDRVVGPERIPSWEDRANLPYIIATVDELHRWASGVPLGIFHATSEADIYRDKTIPTKTTIINNLYAVHHSNDYYGDHEKFIPERFLPKKDPRHALGLAHAAIHYGFGAGRRECPGKHVADASLFIVISRLLWAFNIELGSNTPPSEEILGDYPIIRPAKFACKITPRSEKVAEMILSQASAQDSSLRVEDASQYEEKLMRVFGKQGRVAA